MSKDEIYANSDNGEQPFRFNSAVAEVFPDMLRRSIPGYAASIEAISSLVERCRDIVASDSDQHQTSVEVRQADIQDIEIKNASMVVMNYTLQFLDVNARAAIVQRIYDGLLPGGLFLLSEKVVDQDPYMEDLLVDLHHEHKRRNDYSQLEISRKRAALENVLLPESVPAHRKRLAAAGFKRSAVWLRYFNFVSIVAIK